MSHNTYTTIIEEGEERVKYTYEYAGDLKKGEPALDFNENYSMPKPVIAENDGKQNYVFPIKNREVLKESISTDFRYEEDFIDPVLNAIKDNQEYLTQKENLPQLAKLGYIYNTLWYIGRVVWGDYGKLWDKYRRIIIKSGDEEEGGSYYSACEDNPKYKIEMCYPKTEEIENLIYDAWGMHVDNGFQKETHEEFISLVRDGKELSEYQKAARKPNKTLDEWVELLTDERYQYSSMFPSRKSVLNHMLCVIGNGYSISKDGYIIYTASGADQDIDLYGDWENAKFTADIQKIVDPILDSPYLKETFEAYDVIRKEYQKKEDERQLNFQKGFYSILDKAGIDFNKEEPIDQDEYLKLVDKAFSILNKGRKSNNGDKAYVPIFESTEEEEYRPYYPISSFSKITTICDPEARKREGIKEMHQSYIDGCIEVCRDILTHEKEELGAKHGGSKDNVMYAKKFLTNLGVEDFSDSLPKEVDKHKVFAKVNSIFLELGIKHDENFSQANYGTDSMSLTLSDTAVNKYGDNNIRNTICYSDDSEFPIGVSNDIDIFDGTPYYETYKDIYEKLNSIEEVKCVLFHFQNSPLVYPENKVVINFEIILSDPKHKLEIKENEGVLDSKGFHVGKNYIVHQGLTNIEMVTSKPEPLGSTHPNNKTGEEYFSQNKQMTVFYKGKPNVFQIDERSFNTISPISISTKMVETWVLKEHRKMKKSDPAFGTYDSQNRDNTKEGSRKLYAHDFILWLRDNPLN